MFQKADTIELEYENGTRIQLVAGRATVVPLLESTDDIREAKPELANAGLATGKVDDDDAWEWFEVSAPGGQRFEIVQRRAPFER